MKPEKILVTGGAGYIGSHVVHELCDQGYDVTIMDNMSSGVEINIDPRTKFIEGDLLVKADLEKTFAVNPQVVFHFAAFKAAGESMIYPEKYAHNNICGTLNLLNKMAEKGSRAMVFSSSAAVYGDPKYLPIDEKHTLQPVNYYGYTKLAIEENLKWYSQLKGIRFAALRYFNATGYDLKGRILGKEPNPANLSPIVMEVACAMRDKMQLFGDDYDTDDGTCIRDYIHVNDLSTAHLKAMKYIIAENKDLIINLGTGKGQSVLEVIKAAEKVTGNPIDYIITERRAGDPAKLYADAKKASELLDWQTEYSDLQTIFESMKKVYFPKT